MKNSKAILAMLALAAAYGVYRFAGEFSPLKRLMAAPENYYVPYHPDIEVVHLRDDLASAAEPGRTTVFAFVAVMKSGPVCTQLVSNLQELTAARPDVAVRIVDMGLNWRARDDWKKTGVRIFDLPHVVIYSPAGKRIAADDGPDKSGTELLRKWIEAEVKRSKAG